CVEKHGDSERRGALQAEPGAGGARDGAGGGCVHGPKLRTGPGAVGCPGRTLRQRVEPVRAELSMRSPRRLQSPQPTHLPRTPAAGGAAHTLRLDGAHLPAGTYLIRAEGEAFRHRVAQGPTRWSSNARSTSSAYRARASPTRAST